VSGVYAEDYIKSNIFNPLGMKDTYFDITEDMHKKVSLCSDKDMIIFNKKHDRDKMPPRTGGGGVYSTMHDIWKFGQMTLDKGLFNNNRILSRKSIELMTRNHLTGVYSNYWGEYTSDFPMGLGWQLRPEAELATPGTFFHKSASHCGLYIDPTEQFVAVYMIPVQKENKEAIKNSLNIMWSGIL